jgi:hypothetical protein
LLKKGKNKKIYLVDDETDMRTLFDKLIGSASEGSANGKKIPEVFYLKDGTRVQLRTESNSGGISIDIKPPSGKQRTVHLND